MRNRIIISLCVAILLVMAGVAVPMRSVSAGSPAQETEEPAKCDAAFIEQINTDFAAIDKAGAAITGQPKIADVVGVAQVIMTARTKYEDLTPVPAGCEAVQKTTVAFLASTEDLLLLITAVAGDSANQAAYMPVAKPVQDRNTALKTQLATWGITFGKPAAAATEAK